jgi:hypothetical protein
MVTTERPTPSADGTPPPTIACAGAADSNASATIRKIIFIEQDLDRGAAVAKLQVIGLVLPRPP